jgi:hypothetical protein
MIAIFLISGIFNKSDHPQMIKKRIPAKNDKPSLRDQDYGFKFGGAKIRKNSE